MKENNFKFWKNVWDNKGNSNSEDLLYLDGYEHLNIKFNSQDMANEIKNIMKIKETDMVLEIGCGAGFLGKEFSKFCIYNGIDYSKGLVKKHKKWFKNSVFLCEANKLFYQDKSFDKVFCYGVFQYFPDMDYAKKVISEMIRVSKESIFIGDLKKESYDKHMVYKYTDFSDFGKELDIIPCLYSQDDLNRFNVLIKV